MPSLEQHRRIRPLTVLIALLFAALTLLTGGPHGHVSDTSGTGCCIHLAASHHHPISGETADCPLCQWQTITYHAPSVPVETCFLRTVPVVVTFASTTVDLVCLPVPHRGLRAPPSFSC